MNMYVGGDSFCHWRSDDKKHWPAIVASGLNKVLYGAGYNGMGFWSVRENLLTFKNSEQFDKTDLFIICHSDPDRTLGNSTSIWPGRNHVGVTARLPKRVQNNITEIYYKYIYEDEVQHWAYEMWLNELNSLLVGKKVIHLPCFASSKNLVDDISFGGKIDIPLMNVGISELLYLRGYSYDKWYSNREVVPKEWFGLPYNHLSINSNNQVAQYIINVYNDMNENTNKTYPIILDKH